MVKYQIGRATFYPALNLINIDQQNITLDFNDVIILCYLLNNANRFTTIDNIKKTCFPNEAHAEDIIHHSINSLKTLINNVNNSTTLVFSLWGIVYFKVSHHDKGDADLLKRFIFLLSISLIVVSIILLIKSPQKEYMDSNISTFNFSNNGNNITIVNNINNALPEYLINKVISLDESIKVFYFENNNEINFSIIRKNNINNKSHVVNINDIKAFHSELNRALKI